MADIVSGAIIVFLIAEVTTNSLDECDLSLLNMDVRGPRE